MMHPSALPVAPGRVAPHGRTIGDLVNGRLDLWRPLHRRDEPQSFPAIDQALSGGARALHERARTELAATGARPRRERMVLEA
jgi:hypothetical protein